MSTVRTRRLTAATLMLTAALGLTACGTGGSTQTNQQYQPGIGANVRTGDVRLYNALLVANTDDTYALSVGLLNTTDEEQTLESVTVRPLEGSGSVTAEPALPVELQPRQLYTLGRQGEVADIDGSSVELGRYARLTLTFSGGDEVEIEAPIVARTSTYSDVAEKPVSPESSATPAPPPAADPGGPGGDVARSDTDARRAVPILTDRGRPFVVRRGVAQAPGAISPVTR